MSLTSTEPVSGPKVRISKAAAKTATKVSKASSTPVEKPLDLSKATVATAALPSKSIYEIMGITSRVYKTNVYEDYQEDLAAMPLHALHEHAYEVGIAATEDRRHLIDNLERKFLQENGRQGRAREKVVKTEAQELRDRALRALAHGM